MMAGTKPASALPVQAGPGPSCPFGYSFINFGPLYGYCAENSDNEFTGCPPNYKPAFVGKAPVCNLPSGNTSSPNEPVYLQDSIDREKALLRKNKNDLQVAKRALVAAFLNPWGSPESIAQEIKDIKLKISSDESGLREEEDQLVALRKQYYSAYVPLSSQAPGSSSNAPPAYAESSSLGDEIGPHLKATDFTAAAPADGGVGVTVIPVFGGFGMNGGGFSGSSAYGGLEVGLDFSRALNLDADQHLAALGGLFSDRTTANTSGAGGSTAYGWTAVFGTGFSFGRNYLTSIALFGRGAENLSLEPSGATGSTRDYEKAFDISGGHMFTLWDPDINSVSDILADGWKTVTLDVAGNIEYGDARQANFVDSMGAFSQGNWAEVWSVGPSATLSALFKQDNTYFIPYVTAQIDFAPRIEVSSAALTSSGPIVDRATPYFEAGLDVSSGANWSIVGSAFFEPSPSVRSYGGRLVASIHF